MSEHDNKETLPSLEDYGDWSADDAAEEHEQVKEDSSGSEFLSIPADSTKHLRLIPRPRGQRGSPFWVFWKHMFKDPESGRLVAFACPKQMARRRCPTCEESILLKKSPHKADQELSWEMRAKKRVLVPVVDRDDGRVKLWEIGAPMGKPKGRTVYEKLLNLRKDPDIGGNYLDPSKNGYDVIVQRTGASRMDTSYDVYLAKRPSPLADDAEEAIGMIEGQPDINWYVTPPTDDQLDQLLAGEAPKRDGGGSKPAVRGARAPRAALRSGKTAADFADDDYDDPDTDRPSF